MSRAGVGFLHSWMQSNMTDADEDGHSSSASELADKCRDAAATKGLWIDDEPEFGSVESIINARMQSSRSAENVFFKVWASMPKAPRLH